MDRPSSPSQHLQIPKLQFEKTKKNMHIFNVDQMMNNNNNKQLSMKDYSALETARNEEERQESEILRTAEESHNVIITTMLDKIENPIFQDFVRNENIGGGAKDEEEEKETEEEETDEEEEETEEEEEGLDIIIDSNSLAKPSSTNSLNFNNSTSMIRNLSDQSVDSEPITLKPTETHSSIILDENDESFEA
jgi:hypothetical protein